MYRQDNVGNFQCLRSGSGSVGSTTFWLPGSGSGSSFFRADLNFVCIRKSLLYLSPTWQGTRSTDSILAILSFKLSFFMNTSTWILQELDAPRILEYSLKSTEFKQSWNFLYPSPQIRFFRQFTKLKKKILFEGKSINFWVESIEKCFQCPIFCFCFSSGYLNITPIEKSLLTTEFQFCHLNHEQSLHVNRFFATFCHASNCKNLNVDIFLFTWAHILIQCFVEILLDKICLASSSKHIIKYNFLFNKLHSTSGNNNLF